MFLNFSYNVDKREIVYFNVLKRGLLESIFIFWRVVSMNKFDKGEQPIKKQNRCDSIKNQVNVIKRSGLFNEKFYLSKNNDVASAKIDPVEHFCYFGWKEKRNPSELFDTKYYLDNNLDVFHLEMNPLYHYILFGKKEGRLPRPIDTPITYKRKEKLKINQIVSVIVPNYNHGNFLTQRLESIYNQTYKNLEVILLDDASTDNSRQILDKYAKNNPGITHKIYNQENSGSVFLQWQKGIEAASGDIIWIAESDDYCKENFIEEVLTHFSNEDTVLSYSNSNVVGPDSQFYNTYDNTSWITTISGEKWKKNYYNRGLDEFLGALCIKNTIPNISSVIFKKDPALNAIKFSLKYKKAGDWIFYAYMCICGNVAYCSNPLNYHRRHKGTVTTQESNDTSVEEIYQIHKHFVSNFYVPHTVRESMVSFIESEYDIYAKRKSVSKPLSKLYNKEEIIHFPLKPKIALFQHGLNFGKGGAERILIEKANQLFAKGYYVSIFNRTYHESPLPYKLNPNIPVYSVGIKEDLGDLLKEDKPNICIVNSIGHSDIMNIDQFHKFDIPVILSMHQQPNFFDKSPGKKDHMLSLKSADCIVTLVSSFKDEYKKRGIQTPIKVIPNFVFSPKVDGEFKGLQNRKYIFTAGRLVEQKQQYILIDAFSKIADNFPQWDLIIAGEGHLRLNLEQQILSYGLEDRIRLIGEVNNIGDYYKYCDLFVLPSKYEGFSLAILEAASFGKPILLFKDCSPYGQIIKENDGLILVTDMTSDSLAKAMCKYITNNNIHVDEKTLQFYRQYMIEAIIPKWERLISAYYK